MAMFASCTNEDPDVIAARDREKIISYLKERDLYEEAIKDPSGLFYIVEDKGSGVHPTLTSRVVMKYVGYLLDDTTKVFDRNDRLETQLANTIEGWRVGIPKFRSGGKGKLFVPSAMGYGPYPRYGSLIPRNACLVFEFTIIDVGISHIY